MPGRKQLFLTLLAGLLLLTGVASAQSSKEAKPADSANPPELALPALLARAIEQNPELRAMRKEIAAKETLIPQSKALMDPMLEVKLSNMTADRLSLRRDPMSGVEVMLRQPVPYPGKRALRGEIASFEASMAREEYRGTLLEVIAKVKRTYYDLWEAERALEIVRLTQGSLEDMAKIAEEKYAVGMGLQQDVLKAQVEVSRLLDDGLMWERMKEGARAELNAALGQPPQSPLGSAGKVEKSEVALNLSNLQEQALQSSPMLRERDFAIRRAQANQSLATRDLKPDFEFGLGYMLRYTIPGDPMSGTDMVSASVGLNLPVYAKQKQRKHIEETGNELEAARAREEAARLEAFSMLADLVAQAQRNSRQIDLFRRGIIPQAELAFESVRAGYQVGKVDFLSLLDAQVKLYEYQLSYYQALAAYQKSLVKIERTAGITLF